MVVTVGLKGWIPLEWGTATSVRTRHEDIIANKKLRTGNEEDILFFLIGVTQKAV